MNSDFQKRQLFQLIKYSRSNKVKLKRKLYGGMVVETSGGDKVKIDGKEYNVTETKKGYVLVPANATSNVPSSKAKKSKSQKPAGGSASVKPSPSQPPSARSRKPSAVMVSHEEAEKIKSQTKPLKRSRAEKYMITASKIRSWAAEQYAKGTGSSNPVQWAVATGALAGSSIVNIPSDLWMAERRIAKKDIPYEAEYYTKKALRTEPDIAQLETTAFIAVDVARSSMKSAIQLAAPMRVVATSEIAELGRIKPIDGPEVVDFAYTTRVRGHKGFIKIEEEGMGRGIATEGGSVSFGEQGEKPIAAATKPIGGKKPIGSKAVSIGEEGGFKTTSVNVLQSDREIRSVSKHVGLAGFEEGASVERTTYTKPITVESESGFSSSPVKTASKTESNVVSVISKQTTKASQRAISRLSSASSRFVSSLNIGAGVMAGLKVGAASMPASQQRRKLAQSFMLGTATRTKQRAGAATRAKAQSRIAPKLGQQTGLMPKLTIGSALLPAPPQSLLTQKVVKKAATTTATSKPTIASGFTSPILPSMPPIAGLGGGFGFDFGGTRSRPKKKAKIKKGKAAHKYMPSAPAVLFGITLRNKKKAKKLKKMTFTGFEIRPKIRVI